MTIHIHLYIYIYIYILRHSLQLEKGSSSQLTKIRRTMIVVQQLLAYCQQITSYMYYQNPPFFLLVELVKHGHTGAWPASIQQWGTWDKQDTSPPATCKWLWSWGTLKVWTQPGRTLRSWTTCCSYKTSEWNNCSKLAPIITFWYPVMSYWVWRMAALNSWWCY